jgi:hypothetical protein
MRPRPAELRRLRGSPDAGRPRRTRRARRLGRAVRLGPRSRSLGRRGQSSDGRPLGAAGRGGLPHVTTQARHPCHPDRSPAPPRPRVPSRNARPPQRWTGDARRRARRCPAEFEAYGEPADAAGRAERLDEGLELIDELWSGKLVSDRGRHYRGDGVRHRLRPVQSPRVPIWIGGASGRALRRAAQWDGWTAGLIVDHTGAIVQPPASIARSVSILSTHRVDTSPFDVVVAGYSDANDTSLVAGYESVGVTWWLESINGFRGSPSQLIPRIEAGPPAR